MDAPGQLPLRGRGEGKAGRGGETEGRQGERLAAGDARPGQVRFTCPETIGKRAHVPPPLLRARMLEPRAYGRIDLSPMKYFICSAPVQRHGKTALANRSASLRRVTLNGGLTGV